MKRQQDIGLISSGLNAYAAYKGYGMMTGGTIGGGAMSTAPITQLTQLGTTPIGASTVGGVGIAGAAGYGLGKVIGAKEKEAQGMGAGAAIGMAVGGPVGAVIGGAAGGILGGSVICTELKRQGLITNEDYNIHWKYTLNKWNKEDLKGYWIWANPMANKMKTNKTLTKFWYHIMKNKMQYVKYTLGKDKFNLKGLIYNTIIEQGSLLISKFLKFKKTNEVLA